MVEQYVTSSILVSPDNRIVHFSRAGRYMLHPDGAPTTNVLQMVREELQIELHRALMDAREKHVAVDSSPILVRFNGHSGLVILRVRPAPAGDREGFALIVFEEHQPPIESVADAGNLPEASKRRIQELENELAVAQHQMQSLIKEFENSREEMKSSNEEMQSTNEELRSTMEELETSKEELQSINEELQTLNQQNRHKVEELAELSADLQNHLAATDIATLFLDRELRILRFTPKLGNLFSVRVIDQGRPITDVTNRLGYRELEADAQAVLKQLTPVEREIQDQEGRWYLMRILPYRNPQDRIDGVVITFIDIHRRKLAEEQVLKEKDFAETIIQTLHEPLAVLTPEFRVRTANAAFYKNFEATPESITGQNIFEANHRQWDIPSVHQLLEQVLPQKGSFQDVEIDHTFHRLGRRVMLVSAHRVDHLGAILLGVRDLTDKKRSESELLKAEGELRAANQSLQRINADLMHFSYAVSHDMQEPLRMVTSFTQLLARELPNLDPQSAQYMRYAVEGASRMETLLAALREYWSIDEEKLKGLTEVDCNAALQRALSYLQTVIEKTGAVITYDHLPTIPANEYALTLLFQNLVGNAIKYQPPGRTPRIHISVERSAAEWKFSVADNGIGVEPEQRELIFAPFKRLHEKQYSGSGLGLAMCRKIVETLQGRILVESNAGEGSTFQFILPRTGGV
jgi:two-component system CheB/CheR fusion protein